MAEFPLPTGQTNAAIGTSVVAGISSLLLIFDTPLFERLLGDGAPAGSRATVVVGILAAWAIVTAADLLARAVAAAHETTEPAGPVTQAETGGDGTSPDSGPRVTTTCLLDGRSPGWRLYSVSGEQAVIWKSGREVQRVPLSSLVAE